LGTLPENPTIGFDLSAAKIAAYNECRGPTGEVATDKLRATVKLECTSDPRRLASADFFILDVKPLCAQGALGTKIMGAVKYAHTPTN